MKKIIINSMNNEVRRRDLKPKNRYGTFSVSIFFSERLIRLISLHKVTEAQLDSMLSTQICIRAMIRIWQIKTGNLRQK